MTPQAARFERAPKFDRFCRGWKAWRTPQDVLVALPPGCQEIELTEVATQRGTTLVVTKPEHVFSIWPIKKKKEESE